MPKRFEGIFVRNYLNIYLVVNELKPATEFMLNHQYSTDIKITTKVREEQYLREMSRKKRNILQHKKTLEKLEAVYHIEEEKVDAAVYDDNDKEIETFSQEIIQFGIAKNSKTLDKLLELLETKKVIRERITLYFYIIKIKQKS